MKKPTVTFRHPAGIAMSLLTTSQIPALKEHWTQYKEWAKVILDGLLEVQDRELRLFPFPNLSGTGDYRGPSIERMIAEHPDALRGNWIIV